MVLQNGIDSKLNLTLPGKELVEADIFTHWVSCISSDGCILDDMSFLRILEDRSVFTKFRHLWCWLDIRLSITGSICRAAVLLCGSEVWPLRSDVREPLVVEYCGVRSISNIW